MPKRTPAVATVGGRPPHAAYLAGLFDGEGTVMVPLSRDSKGRRYHRVVVRIVNTDVAVLRWCVAFYGGSIQPARLREGRKRVHAWVLGQRRAATFLADVEPYLRIKVKQARLAIAVANTMVVGNRHVTPRVLAYRARIAQKIAHLNRRGTCLAA